MEFTPGYNKAVTFKVDGAGSATTLKVTDWSWEEQVNALVTTHTGSGGKATRIAGVLDGDGTVTANVDIDALPNATAPGIVAGAKATITYSFGTATPWSAHVLVTKVNYRSQVGGLLTYNFNVALDDDGSYTRAADA